MVNILTLIDPDEYSSKVHLVLKDAEEISSKTVYVSLNKTYNSLTEQLKDKGIDFSKITFIDTITATIIEPKPIQNCVYIESSDNFKDLQNCILNTVKTNSADLLVFDSLSSLTTYKESDEIVKFMKILLASLSINGCSAILTCLKDDEHLPLINKIKLLVNKTINLG
ncbi:MAG: ATPase domain-containing protein [archaeon]